MWPTGETEGMVFIANVDVVDQPLDLGTVVGEVCDVVARTLVCGVCAAVDTLAWPRQAVRQSCTTCHQPVPEEQFQDCAACGAAPSAGCELSYSGCISCRPERRFEPGPQRSGPAGVAPRATRAGRTRLQGIMGRALLALAAVQTVSDGQYHPAAAAHPVNVREHPVYHIVEEPGGIEHMVDCEMPTEEYYGALSADMAQRHPKAQKWVLEHLATLEPFLDNSIVAGFSFGVNKAQVCVIKGELLGHIVARTGSSPDGSRIQAIREFAPLKEPQHIRQFLGSTNWIRWYLVVQYPICVKMLGEFLKPGAEFPAVGLGHPSDKSDGTKAVRCIKAMAQHCIETAVMDEAAALDGSRPLEIIADACGYAWGATAVQMTEDLSRFKVLLMVGKGFTPAQQAWSALTLEANAQLMGKRAQRKTLGPMRTLNWTDHANLTEQQHTDPEDIEVKHLRWISEIVADVSELLSLSGSSARLGDGTSLNP